MLQLAAVDYLRIQSQPGSIGQWRFGGHAKHGDNRSGSASSEISFDDILIFLACIWGHWHVVDSAPSAILPRFGGDSSVVVSPAAADCKAEAAVGTLELRQVHTP